MPTMAASTGQSFMPEAIRAELPEWVIDKLHAGGAQDADALDRVRINDLNPAFLRLPQSHGMIDFAEQLFLNTDHVLTPGPRYFAELIEEVDLL